MIEFDLVFVTTHQDNKFIGTLLNSIAENENIKLLTVVVSQEIEIETKQIESDFNVVFNIKTEKLSLSKARNLALKLLYEREIRVEYIMFPDDDSSFDFTFFNDFRQITNGKVSYITPIYVTGTKQPYLRSIGKDDQQLTVNDYHLVGSPNQIILYSSLCNSMLFDEDLGVGAKYGSCEDIDFYLKLCKRKIPFIFTSKLYSYHPSKADTNYSLSLRSTISRYKNYSKGFVYVIKKYKFFKWIPSFLIRSLGGGIVSIFKLNFKMAAVYFVLFFVRINLLFTKIKFNL